jgi:hypothetical protein
MRPTDEQAAALELFLAGESMVIDALAGTGKTTTLRLLAASTRRTGRYLAYNKAIVVDVAGKLPARCSASTAHSLAFATVGKQYAHRLSAPRMKSWEVAQRLGIGPLVVSAGLPNPKRLAPGWLAGHVMRAVADYCNSADEVPSTRHFPYADGIDLPDSDGRRTVRNNLTVADELEGALRKAWQDLSNPDGHLRYSHDCYLKSWALSHPRIPVGYVLLDEAQDTNPVLAGVLAEQTCQVVYVGDPQQQLYSWRGAIDAMSTFASDHRRSLTRTFRFGPAIADEANAVLEMLDAPLRIIADPDQHSTVGEYDGEPDALLCRTNAAAIEAVLAAHERRQPVHLVGGGTEVASFARAVKELQETGRTTHHELACFDSWNEVQSYVRDDPGGSELKLLVRLIDEFGVASILRAVDGTAPEGPGVLTVSTGHKAKGREWPVVRIAADFVDVEPDADELRLRYVAFTRAREHLDESVFQRLPAAPVAEAGVA